MIEMLVGKTKNQKEVENKMDLCGGSVLPIPFRDKDTTSSDAPAPEFHGGSTMKTKERVRILKFSSQQEAVGYGLAISDLDHEKEIIRKQRQLFLKYIDDKDTDDSDETLVILGKLSVTAQFLRECLEAEVIYNKEKADPNRQHAVRNYEMMRDMVEQGKLIIEEMEIEI